MATATTMVNGDFGMLETKVILIALAKICREADDIKEVYETLEDMANAEGIKLKPLNYSKKTAKTAKTAKTINRKRDVA